MCFIMWDQSPKLHWPNNIGPNYVWNFLALKLLLVWGGSVCFGRPNSTNSLETWVLKNKTHQKFHYIPFFIIISLIPSSITMQSSLSSKQDLNKKVLFVMSSNYEEVVTQDYSKSTFSIYPTTWRCSSTTWRSWALTSKSRSKVRLFHGSYFET